MYRGRKYEIWNLMIQVAAQKGVQLIPLPLRIYGEINSDFNITHMHYLCIHAIILKH